MYYSICLAHRPDAAHTARAPAPSYPEGGGGTVLDDYILKNHRTRATIRSRAGIEKAVEGQWFSEGGGSSKIACRRESPPKARMAEGEVPQ